MTIYISSASHDENSKYSGGAAGDQTGTEVYIRNFYMHSKGWVILRPKSVAIANKVASGGKDLANNDNVGYDQNQRGTLLTQYKKYGSIAKIATKCECDCSSSTRVVVYQATGKDPGDFTTANEKTVLLATGYFEEKTCNSSADVYNGDILVTKTKGHTVIVTSGRARSTKSTYTGTFPTGTLKKGSKGTQVGYLQKFLNWYGSYGLDVDKDFGSKTQAAVKSFQKAEGLSVDGIFGPKSLAKAKTVTK